MSESMDLVNVSHDHMIQSLSYENARLSTACQDGWRLIECRTPPPSACEFADVTPSILQLWDDEVAWGHGGWIGGCMTGF